MSPWAGWEGADVGIKASERENKPFSVLLVFGLLTTHVALLFSFKLSTIITLKFNYVLLHYYVFFFY